MFGVHDLLDRHVDLEAGLHCAHRAHGARFHLVLALALLVALPFLLDGLAFHAHLQALLIPTVLTSVALSLVDDTVAILPAGVAQILSNGSLKEALTSFAAVGGRETISKSL